MSRQALLALAVEDCRLGKLTTRKAAVKYHVPWSTIKDCLSGRIQDHALWGSAPILSMGEEEELVEYALGRVKQGLGLTKDMFLRYMGTVAAKKGVHFKNGFPSDKWWRLFKARHPNISLRHPEATATARHKGMEEDRIQQYFVSVHDTLARNNLLDKPHKIWNMDETGLILCHRPPKVLARCAPNETCS